MSITIAQSIYQEGALEHARALILKLGGKRFGQADEETVARVNSVVDLDLLADQVLETHSWAELLETASPLIVLAAFESHRE